MAASNFLEVINISGDFLGIDGAFILNQSSFHIAVGVDCHDFGGFGN
jgi:hypothetical protein